MTTSLKNRKKIYGMELILEIFGCDIKDLQSKERIQEYLDKATKAVKLEQYGKARIKRFMGGNGWDKGYSFFQFLTTSSITGHYIEPDRVAFINIFSCSTFDPDMVIELTKKFFKVEKIKTKLIVH